MPRVVRLELRDRPLTRPGTDPVMVSDETSLVGQRDPDISNRPLRQACSRTSSRRTSASVVRGLTYLLAPILNILVLHSGHSPSVAGRPFFIVICLAFF